MKKTAIFGLERLLSTPCRSETRAGTARPRPVVVAVLAAANRRPERAAAEIEEIRAAGDAQREERRLGRANERGDAEARRERPDEEAGRGSDARRDSGAPPARERVPHDERRVGARRDDDQRREREERDEMSGHRGSVVYSSGVRRR